MKTIQLTGRLAKAFGEFFRFDIVDPAEAIRALCYQIPGFEEELRKGHYRVTRLQEDEKKNTDIDENEIYLAFGKSIGLRIEPVIQGSKKKGGLGKIILGVVLISAAFILPGAAGLSQSLIAGSKLTYGTLAQLGVAMLAQGVSSLLTPSVDDAGTDEDESSHMIDATGNMIEQGHPVPVVFGEVFTGSVVVSAGISTEEYPIT